ncbi:MAG TPA: hypothetical protein VH158_03570 [Gemmatimonadales bacterium]|nr:hypothetical protein [Gemmatimonadales bacterium]
MALEATVLRLGVSSGALGSAGALVGRRRDAAVAAGKATPDRLLR